MTLQSFLEAPEPSRAEERSQYPILQNYHLVDRPSIRCDRSLSF
ncbi:hypothetical protein [Microcoleus vaginatus]